MNGPRYPYVRAEHRAFTLVETMFALLLLSILMMVIYNVFSQLRRVEARSASTGADVLESYLFQVVMEEDFCNALSAPGWSKDRTMYSIDDDPVAEGSKRLIFWSALSRPYDVRGACRVMYSIGDGCIVRRVFQGSRHLDENMSDLRNAELVERYLAAARWLDFVACADETGGRWTGKGLPYFMNVRFEFALGRCVVRRSRMLPFGYSH